MTVQKLWISILILLVIVVGILVGFNTPTTSQSVAQNDYTLEQVLAAWLNSVQVCITSSDFDDTGKFVETTTCHYEIPDWINPAMPPELPFETPTPAIDTPVPATEIPITPAPTYTPVNIPITCVISNATDITINMRSGPGTGFAVLGSWSPGESLTTDEFTVNGGYRWAHVGINPDLWVAVYQNSWWIYGFGCEDVKGFDNSWEPPPTGPSVEQETLVGAHVSAPLNYTTLQNIYSLPRIRVFKGVTLAGGNVAEVKLARPDITTFFRVTNPECPSRYEVYYNPLIYADKLWSAWLQYGPDPSLVDYYEIMNECAEFSGIEDYQALAQFFIQVADYLHEHMGICALVGGFGPGNPLVADFGGLGPYVVWANKSENACGVNFDGTLRYHGISAHSSACPPFPTPQFPWNCWEWITFRHRMYNDLIFEKTGINMLKSNVPYAMTEVGITYGFSEDQDVFTAEEKMLTLQNTQSLFEEDGVDYIAWWNFCGGDNCWGWLNDSDDIVTMFDW